MYYTKYFKNCYIRIHPGLQDSFLLDFLEFTGFSNYYCYYYILQDYNLKELFYGIIILRDYKGKGGYPQDYILLDFLEFTGFSNL